MSVVLADIGATNARFCVLKNGRLSEMYQFVCNDFQNAYQLIDGFIRLYGNKEDYMIIMNSYLEERFNSFEQYYEYLIIYDFF